MGELTRICFFVFVLWTGCFSTASGRNSTDSNLRWITISQSRLDHEEVIELDSGWFFHWNQLLDPAQSIEDSQAVSLKNLGSWTVFNPTDQPLPSSGVATYHLNMVLPTNRQPVSIHLPKINSAARLWINENLVYEIGKVGLDEDQTLHRREETLIPISDHADTIQLTLQVVNFYHKKGGLIWPPQIALTRTLWDRQQIKLISNIVLIGCLMFMGVSMLLLYYVYWRNDKAILYLALFSLSWGYRGISDEYAPLAYYFADIPWIIHVKIEYLSLFFGSLMGLHYLRMIFRRIFSQTYSIVINGICLMFIIIVLLIPSALISNLLLPFFFCMFGLILYNFIILVTSKTQRKESILAILAIITGLTIVSYHLISFNLMGEANPIWISIGYLLTMILNALLLGKRFSVTYMEKEKQQKLTEQLNQEINKKADELNLERNLLEEKVAQRTKEIEKVMMDLKERNLHLEQFNYIISHNMRAPVSNIIGLTHLYNLKNAQDPFNLITISKIKESVSALDQVLKDITGVLEVKQKLNLPNEKVDFHELIEKVKKSISNEIKEAKIAIELELEVESVISNRPYWYSILINLISNAIKYSRSEVDSFIKVRSTRISDSQIKVQVEDNGLGLDLKKNEQEIFGLYKRFHNHVEGKGMGLFMVRTQVEALGGKITVESTPGQGSTFTILV